MTGILDFSTEKKRKKCGKGFSRQNPNNFDAQGNYTIDAMVEELLRKSMVRFPVDKERRDKILQTKQTARDYLNSQTEKGFDFTNDADVKRFYQDKLGKIPKKQKAKKLKAKTGPNFENGVNLKAKSAANASPWKVFNLNKKTATERDAKRAFRDAATRHHPDQGGDPSAFKNLVKIKDRALLNFGETSLAWDWISEFGFPIDTWAYII